MEPREEISSRRLAAAATRAATPSPAPSAHVHDYFRDQASWERVLRRGFMELRGRFDAGEEVSVDLLTPRVAEVNRRYPTRCKGTLFRPLAECILARLAQEPWWRTGERPTLLHAEAPTTTLGGVVPDVLAALKRIASGEKRPLSLTTKCLHFLFPDAFAIFDSQAANSIQMWAYFAFPLGSDDAKRFGPRSVADPDGRGYGHLLAFYERVWRALTADGRAALDGAGRALDSTLGEDGSASGEYVGVLDVIDKHLWRGDGNPLVLGLADPPA